MKIKELKEKLGSKLISIMIDVDKKELFKRLNSRGDNKTEISRRIEDDMKRFCGFKPDYEINNNEIEDAVYQLECIIKKEMENLCCE